MGEKQKNNLRPVIVYIDREDLREIKRMARFWRTSTSGAIRYIILDYIIHEYYKKAPHVIRGKRRKG